MNKKGNKETKKKKLRKGVTTGLASGIIWGSVSLLAYYLQFTDVGTSMYVKPLLNPDYVLNWYSHLIGIGFFIIFSILFSLLYTFTLSSLNSPWIGILFGILLWAFVFLLVNPLLDLTKSVKELGLNTNSIMISIYILMGLFIGYTISIEFNNADKEQEAVK